MMGEQVYGIDIIKTNVEKIYKYRHIIGGLPCHFRGREKFFRNQIIVRMNATLTSKSIQTKSSSGQQLILENDSMQMNMIEFVPNSGANPYPALDFTRADFRNNFHAISIQQNSNSIHMASMLQSRSIHV